MTKSISTSLQSSAIAEVVYVPSAQTLSVYFNDRTEATYANVTPAIHDGLIHADSVGRYFNTVVRKLPLA